ncbi:hypothetical protein [Faecalicatena contorta]|uniref:hypothetical protein n=1 Tax=Faecalicatena contorta TaxID=39482 RepID=UPI000D6AAA87|nr:hypothetical protein [Faecalicatena contorta]
MPQDHQKYLEWNGDRFRKWAERIGNNTYLVVDAILDRIVHDAYMINIQSIDVSKDVSMREIYGLDKSLRE